jgi:hypothetical protein
LSGAKPDYLANSKCRNNDKTSARTTVDYRASIERARAVLS